MNDWHNLTLIVADQDVDLARQLCETAAGPSGSGMLSRACSPTGQLPVTHWCSGGLLRADFAALLGDAQATFDAAGGTVPLEIIQGLYDRSVFVEGDPLPILVEQGLVLIDEE